MLGQLGNLGPMPLQGFKHAIDAVEQPIGAAGLWLARPWPSPLPGAPSRKPCRQARRQEVGAPGKCRDGPSHFLTQRRIAAFSVVSQGWMSSCHVSIGPPMTASRSKPSRSGIDSPSSASTVLSSWPSLRQKSPNEPGCSTARCWKTRIFMQLSSRASGRTGTTARNRRRSVPPIPVIDWTKDRAPPPPLPCSHL